MPVKSHCGLPSIGSRFSFILTTSIQIGATRDLSLNNLDALSKKWDPLKELFVISHVLSYPVPVLGPLVEQHLSDEVGWLLFLRTVGETARATDLIPPPVYFPLFCIVFVLCTPPSEPNSNLLPLNPAQAYHQISSQWSRSDGLCGPQTCQTKASSVTCCGLTPTRMCLAGAKTTEGSLSPLELKWWPSSFTNTTWTLYAELIR